MLINRFFVFDTNVLISALFDFYSSSAVALTEARNQGRLLISNDIVLEYLSVFSRKKFDKWISKENRINFIENIIENAISVEITQQIFACRDFKDNMFLSLAVSAQANCIISGDKDLLILHPFNEIPILSPADFLDKFQILKN
jgi:putative PIN family toxin of toxin-antitoxin system